MLLMIIVAVFVTLVICGRFKWVSQEDLASGNPEVILEKAIKMHRPNVMKVGDQELMYIPTAQLSGKNWSVNYAFYIFEAGALKKLDLKK